MTEEEDDDEDIHIYKMGLSITVSDKYRIERLERQVKLIVMK